MHISLIAAMDLNNAIGYDNQLLWRLPDDLAYFKEKTLHKPLIVGRNTYWSLPNPLPGRRVIVISKTMHHDDVHLEGIEAYPSFYDAINQLRKEDVHECVIGGGGILYEGTIRYADTLYVTEVVTSVNKVDTYFPSINSKYWKMTSSKYHPRDAKHKHPFYFKVYQRRKGRRYI